MGPTASMAEDDIDAVFAINVKVPFADSARVTRARFALVAAQVHRSRTSGSGATPAWAGTSARW